jgi:hypothetical protein
MIDLYGVRWADRFTMTAEYAGCYFVISDERIPGLLFLGNYSNRTNGKTIVAEGAFCSIKEVLDHFLPSPDL